MVLTMEVSSERVELHQDTVLSVAISKELKNALSGSEDGSVSLWSTTDNSLLHSWQPAPDPVNCVSFNPRETAKVYAAVGSSVYVYDTRDLRTHVDKYSYHEEEINQVAIDEKGQYLVSCDDDGLVTCVDIARSGGGKCVSKITCHENICASAQWIPGRTAEIVSGGMDCKIFHRDVYKHRPIKTFNENAEQQGIHIINPPFVNSISTHWDSRYMAAAFGSGDVKVWRLGSRKVGYVPFRSLAPHCAGAGCVSLVDPTTVVSGGNDGFVNVSELESGQSNGHSHGEIDADEKSSIDLDSTFKLFHGHKINWLAGYRDSVGEIILLVCDESTVVTKYSLR